MVFEEESRVPEKAHAKRLTLPQTISMRPMFRGLARRAYSISYQSGIQNVKLNSLSLFFEIGGTRH